VRIGPGQPLIERIASECLAARVRILNRAITSVYDDVRRLLSASNF
jgi:hypothetical protein